MEKKWYLKITDQLGNVILDHKSNSVKELLALYHKKAFIASADKNSFARFYNGKRETNITYEIAYRVFSGENL